MRRSNNKMKGKKKAMKRKEIMEAFSRGFFQEFLFCLLFCVVVKVNEEVGLVTTENVVFFYQRDVYFILLLSLVEFIQRWGVICVLEFVQWKSNSSASVGESSKNRTDSPDFWPCMNQWLLLGESHILLKESPTTSGGSSLVMIFESNHFDWRIESTGTRKLLDRCQISAIPQRERPKLSSKYPPKDPKRS